MNQHSILLEYLRVHGRTCCANLEFHCDVRSVTKRMSELIRKGGPIVKDRSFEANARGRLRPVTYYALASESAQPDLFK